MEKLDIYKKKTLELFFMNQKKFENQRNIKKFLKSNQFEKHLKVVEIYNHKPYKKLSLPFIDKKDEKMIIRSDFLKPIYFSRYRNSLSINSSNYMFSKSKESFLSLKSKDLTDFDPYRKLVKEMEQKIDLFNMRSYKRTFYPSLTNTIFKNYYNKNDEKEFVRNSLPPPNSEFNKTILFNDVKGKTKKKEVNNILGGNLIFTKRLKASNSQMDFYHSLINHKQKDEIENLSKYVSSLSPFSISPKFGNLNDSRKDSNNSNNSNNSKIHLNQIKQPKKFLSVRFKL